MGGDEQSPRARADRTSDPAWHRGVTLITGKRRMLWVPEVSRDPAGMSRPRASLGVLPDDLYIEPRALVESVEVADHEVRIIGSKSNLLQTLTAVAGVKPATPDIRSSVLKWRRG